MLLRPRQILAPLIFATLFGYFGYHLVNGDRGLLAMVHLQRQVRNQSLDPDMLDERARALLNYARRDDVIIFTPTR
jgi:cell division protein FtsB